MFKTFGYLVISLGQVLEARNLPDTDTFFLSKLVNRKDVTDPYVSGYLDTTKVMIDDGLTS